MTQNKIRLYLLICPLLLGANFSFAEPIDPNIAVVKKMGQEIEDLKNTKENLTLEEKTGKAEGILTNLENRTTEENKMMVSIAKAESTKLFAKNIAYNKFLDKIADPDFFNYEIIQDPAKLEQQRVTAQEYVTMSKDMLLSYQQFPVNIKNALTTNKVDSKKITSFINGLNQSEANAKKPASKIFEARVMHAEAFLNGLNHLKAWKGKWNYDKQKDIIIFNSNNDLATWNKDVDEPINTAVAYLSN